jgi:alkylhydroperoxidase family enzyme
MARIEIPTAFQNNPASYAYSVMSPKITQAALAFSEAVYCHSIVSLREFEAARGRVAQINGCTVCQKFRSARDVPGYIEGLGHSAKGAISDRGDPEPDEAFYANLENWRSSTLYSERERVAIDLAERFSLAPKSADNDEAFWKRVKAAYSDAELFDLMLAIGSWVAGGRVMHMLQFDSVCGVDFAPPRTVSQALLSEQSPA